MSSENAPSEGHEPVGASPLEPPAGGTEATAAAAGRSSTSGAGVLSAERLQQDIVDVLRTIYDPEIPVNIYEIGLIYGIDVQADGRVQIRMTLTSPMCPVAESLPPEVEAKVQTVPGVSDVTLDLVWDPPWNPQMMSEDARLLLGIS